MKLTILLILFGFITVSASTYSQEGKYTMSLKNAKIETVLSELQRCINRNLFYSLKDIDNELTIDIDVQDASLNEVLESCLKGTGLGYRFKHETIVLYKIDTANKYTIQQPQKIVITGCVTTVSGESVPGVNVYTKDGTSGTITNSAGKFKMHINKDSKILVFSFIGMKTQEVSIGSTTNFVVVMKEDVETLGDVVVTGIFNKAKESFTGAATLISKKELEEFKSRDILKTISNIDPSFNIVMNDEFGSDPNKLPEINIRGTTSVPTNIQALQAGERANLNTPLFILDGFEISLERMMDLDPEDIESVTLLKDASSTAIYGSRGSNGVVVLTSVKPKAGKLSINVRGSSNLEIPDLSSYNLVNAREKLEIERIAGLYNGEDIDSELKLRDLYSRKMRAVQEGVDTYWLDKPLQTGVGQSYRLSLSGGDPVFRYSLTSSYNNNVAVMKGSYRNNYNGSLSIGYYKDKLSINNTVSVGINSSSNSKYGRFSQYVKLNPYWEMYDENGEMVKVFGEGDPVTGLLNNPLYASQVDSRDERRYTSLRNNTSLEWTPVRELKVGLRAGISQQISEGDFFVPPTHVNYDKETDIRKKGEYRYDISKSNSWELDMTLSYAKVIKKHTLFVGLNGSMRENVSVGYGMTVQGFTHERMDFISMGSQYKGDVPSGNESKGRSVGLTGNVNYNFNQMLYVDGSYRLDGASSFGEYGRFKPYYSIGMGWTASQMNFIRNHLSTISSLRFRYNYGVTSSLQFSSPYQAMTVYRYDIDNRYDGYIGASIQGYGNPGLSWQYTYSHNLGMDLGIFQGKVSLGMNVYRKITEGMTTSMNLPLSHGYSNYMENQGDIENKGIDANVSVRLINKRYFSWSIRAGVAHNRNKILKLSDAMKELSSNAEKYGLDNPNYLYREGESMDALYVVPSLGIDPNTGREVFIDQRGEPTYTWQRYNRRSYGVMQPKVNGRFSTSVRYKGLLFTASFGMRLGGQMYNSTLVSKVESADLRYNVDSRVFSERWQEPGDQAKYKALSATEGGRQSSRFVQDESTLEFRSLSVNYNFPKKFLDHFHLKGGSFSARMNDVFYLSTVKRERGTNYPFSYKPSFSLSFTL